VFHGDRGPIARLEEKPREADLPHRVELVDVAVDADGSICFDGERSDLNARGILDLKNGLGTRADDARAGATSADENVGAAGDADRAGYSPRSTQTSPPWGGRASIASWMELNSPWLAWPSPTMIVQQPRAGRAGGSACDSR
jgi:hypothetical protein